MNMMMAENIIPLNRGAKRRFTILAVEDNRLERAFLEDQIAALGHEMFQAEDGERALAVLRANKDKIDVVLMDRMMPVMDGLTAVRLMKDDPDLRKIPVVMVTGATSSEEIQEGLDAGVFYYLPKPVDENILRSVLTAATNEARQNRTLSEELQKHRTSFNLIHTCKFQFSTLEEAESLAAFMSLCFPDPDRVITGLGELMINAVEHGSAEIGYERKTDLLNNHTLRAETERRLGMEPYSQRFVEAVITRKDDGVYAIITDQGPGFKWKRFMTIDPARSGDNHGRGIAQANAMSFDRMTYNEKGNQVVAYVGSAKVLEW